METDQKTTSDLGCPKPWYVADERERRCREMPRERIVRTEANTEVVGSEGVVYAQNNGISAGRYGPRLALRLERGGLSNVLRVNSELDRLTFPGPLDAAIMVLFYHDTVWMQVDRGEMNRHIFEALKPGGRFLVIDHASLAPHEDRETRSLHRIGEQLVIRELRAAGFVLEARSDLLRNAADPHTDSAFPPGIRGKTDRFALLFRKPPAAA